MTEDNVIQFPGTQRIGVLPEEQIKIACARTIEEWIDIYTEIVVRNLQYLEQQEPALKGIIWERWRSEGKPRLRRICRDFRSAGLLLSEDIEVSGIHLRPNHPVIWENPANPVVTFHWPDGSTITFRGDDAISAVGFFQFWVSQKELFEAPAEGKGRIITPGSREEQAYFDAKRRDQENGLEPEE